MQEAKLYLIFEFLTMDLKKGYLQQKYFHMLTVKKEKCFYHLEYKLQLCVC